MDRIEQIKNDNIDKIRIGVSLEFMFLFENLTLDIKRIQEFIEENKDIFNNQTAYTLKSSLESISSTLDYQEDIIIQDIDKNEEFYDYHPKFY